MTRPPALSPPFGSSIMSFTEDGVDITLPLRVRSSTVTFVSPTRLVIVPPSDTSVLPITMPSLARSALATDPDLILTAPEVTVKSLVSNDAIPLLVYVASSPRTVITACVSYIDTFSTNDRDPMT